VKNAPSPFPIRNLMSRIRIAHDLNGNEGVLALLRRDNTLQEVLGILSVASEAELMPEWQGLRMRMLSAVKAGEAAAKDTAKALANEAAARYEL